MNNETKARISLGAFLLIVASTLLLTTSSSVCSEGWLPTDQNIIFYCESRDIYRACESLSSTNKTCYHITNDDYNWTNNTVEVNDTVVNIADVMKIDFEPECVRVAYGNAQSLLLKKNNDTWVLEDTDWGSLRSCDDFTKCNFPYLIAYEDCGNLNKRFVTSEVIR